MHAFSKQALDKNVFGSAGCVHSLSEERITKQGACTLHVDPRYFCVICLAQSHLTMEIITHEACHAGIYFAERSRHRWPYQEHAPSEAICYPTGRIARAINKFLHDKGLYQ